MDQVKNVQGEGKTKNTLENLRNTNNSEDQQPPPKPPPVNGNKTPSVSPGAFNHFVRLDYQAVHNEILDIKSCRTHIFLGTIGIVGSAFIAVLAIWGAKESSPWNHYLPLASLVCLAILSCAVLATIHKARGINKREGYLEVITEYMLQKKIPAHYAGWFKANRVSYGCRARAGQYSRNASDKKIPRNCPAGDNMNCIDRSKKYTDSSSLPKYPDMLENFTSLSMYLYTFSYLVCLAIFLISLMYSARSWPIFKVGFNDLCYILAIEIGILPSLVYYFFNRGETLRFKNLFIWLVIVVFVALILYVTATELGGFEVRHDVLYAYGLGLFPSALLMYMGGRFLSKVRSLRQGDHSLERWRYIWQLRFSSCPAMAEETVCN